MIRLAKHTALALAVLCLALCLDGMTAAAAQEAPAPAKKKQTPPPAQPAKEVHFPPFEQRTLGNGLKVVVVEQHETPAVGIQLLVQAGKAHEPATKAGLAQATADLLRQGTATRSAQQIAEAIDSVGGDLSTSGGWDSAYAVVQLTSDQVDFGLDLLSDIMLRPSFPAEEVERWRRQSLNSLQVQMEDASYLAETAFARAVFGNHPYGLPDEGTPASVQAITRDDIVAFHKARYVATGAILAVVGDVKAADVFTKVEKAFGGWAKGTDEKVPPVAEPKREKPRVIVIDKPDAVQTEIRAGHVGLAFTDPDYFASLVYNSVLGQSGSSRLYNEVRRKRGLSYGAASNFLPAYQPGWFQVSTFTKTESTAEALKVSLDVVEDLAKEPVPATELTERKTYLTGVFPMQIETPQGISSQIIQAFKYGYDRKWLETYRDKIDAVNAQQLQSFAQRRIHPDRALVVLVGNASGFKADLEKTYGPVEVIPYHDLDLARPELRKK